MTRAYSELYIDEVMDNLGSMMDYGVHSLDIDLELFYHCFLVSGIADEISCGNPKYLCGIAGSELALMIAERTGLRVDDKEPLIYPGAVYWTGWILAYLQWYFNMSFQALHTKGITAKSIFLKFNPLHEAPIDKTVDIVARKLKDYERTHAPLKTARKNAGLTQRQLAEQSGVPLRTIRAYEQSRIVGGRASAQGMYNIASVLGCPLDYLLGTQDKIR